MRAELLGCGLTVEGQLGVRLSEPNVCIPDRIIGAPNDSEGTTVKQVACGENHSIFLTNDGKMWSVGGNSDGQLGRGGRSEGSFSIYPVSTSCGAQIVQIAAGRAHSVAIAEDGRVFAWGSNEHGQLGMTSQVQRQEVPKRIAALNEIVQIDSGSDHCIALSESGSVYVWGEQADGKCLHEPKLMEELSGVPITRVIAGSRHCVVVSASGSVFTWGQNDYGQLGFDDLRPRTRIHHLEQMDGLGVVEAACGDRHTVLLTHSGRVFSFGCDSLGQCGFDKKIEKRTNPTAVTDLIGSVVTRIAAGRCHTLAIIGGFVYPFGLNSSGQLGNGSLRSLGSPRKTDDLDHVMSVFAGWDQTFFIRSSKMNVHEIAGPNAQLKYPQKLTKKALEATIKSGERLDVMGLIETVLSSLSSINNSFLYEDERRFDVGEGRSHGINLDEVMETFMILDESTRKQYDELIIDTLLMALEHRSIFFASIECLRVYFILPWLSVFIENVKEETVKKLHEPFFHSLCKLNLKLASGLKNWWKKLPTRHFRRIVNVTKAALKVLIQQKKTPFECQNYLQVLSELNKINKEHHIIPLETFYIDELNEAIDLKQDYYIWVVESRSIQQEMQDGEEWVPVNHWSCFPFVLNPIAKGDLLHVEAIITQQLRVQSAHLNSLFSFAYDIPVLELHVRRESIVSDTMNRMASIEKSDLQKPLKVKIHGEEADDAGGVQKEFFLIVMQKILQSEYGMFTEDDESHLVWFSGLSDIYCERQQFRHLGRLVGLAVYNRVLVPFPFPLVLYKLLLNQQASLEDLIELHPTEGNSLQKLLEYEGDDVEDVFGLYFTISFNQLGEVRVMDLVKGGAEKAVTNDNRKEFVELYVARRLELGFDDEIRGQAKSFSDGFHDAFHSRYLSCFQPRELMELVVGNENYEWSMFREIVKYRGEFDANHPAIQAFWKAFYQLDDGQKKKFLQFLTGSTRLPVAGMSALNVDIQPCAKESLPVAHTCFNLLDLPNISDADEMLRRLLISIEHTHGFTLV